MVGLLSANLHNYTLSSYSGVLKIIDKLIKFPHIDMYIYIESNKGCAPMYAENVYNIEEAVKGSPIAYT